MGSVGCAPVTVEPTSLLAQLTLAEKCNLLVGADLWRNHGVERLGLRALKVSDGPVGVRGDQWTGEATSTSFPCGSALGATWDIELLQRIGAAIGREARAKGVHVVLGPTVNLHRTPLAGRNMECYSEDPLLSGRLGTAWVRGLQSERVACTVKHFVANDQEHERHTISAEVDERTLRELYLRPFEMIVRDGEAWGVMSAYNKLNGTHCSEHPWLLTTVLRDEWGFDGFVISDWFGTHSTGPMLEAQLDLEMPGPAQRYGRHLVRAVEAGEVEEALVDRAVANLLRLYERTGALDVDDDRNYGPEGSALPSHQDLAFEAAVGSFVLLHNDGLLPLDAETVGSIVVIGPNAEVANIQGGGSARLNPDREPTPLEGISERFGRDRVSFARGCVSYKSIPPIEARRTKDSIGLTTEYFANVDFDGDVVRTDRMNRGFHMWLGEWSADVPWEFSARTRATVVADEAGDWTFALVSAGRSRLFVDDVLVVDNWDPIPGDFYFGMGSAEVRGTVPLTEGQQVDVVVEFASTMAGLAGVNIGLFPPEPADLMERAVAAATEAEVAIVVIGTNADWETEGADRADMWLPMRQRELIERVAAANPRTVVCVNAGASLDLEWLSQVGATLWCGLPGQAWGDALAAVLAGDADPGGRLPMTMPKRLEDNPAFTNYPGEEGKVLYGERGFIGYRWYETRAIEPALPFGHGLSYTSFDYGPLWVSADEIGRDDGVVVELDVSNLGPRDGVEVVQCYVRDVAASVARPVQELVAFTKLRLAAGESQRVRFELDARAFAFWSTTSQRWLVEPGEFDIRVGRSSADLRVSTVIRCVERT